MNIFTLNYWKQYFMIIFNFIHIFFWIDDKKFNILVQFKVDILKIKVNICFCVCIIIIWTFLNFNNNYVCMYFRNNLCHPSHLEIRFVFRVNMGSIWILTTLLVVTISSVTSLKVGVARVDVTGPAAEITFVSFYK